MITNKKYNVDLANLSDRKLMFEFAKGMYFDEKALSNKSTRDKSLIRLLKSPAIMAGFLKKSKPIGVLRDFHLPILMNFVIE